MRLRNCIVEILKNVLLWGYVIKVKIGGVEIGGLIHSCVGIEVRVAFLIYGMEEGAPRDIRRYCEKVTHASNSVILPHMDCYPILASLSFQ